MQECTTVLLIRAGWGQNQIPVLSGTTVEQVLKEADIDINKLGSESVLVNGAGAMFSKQVEPGDTILVGTKVDNG